MIGSSNLNCWTAWLPKYKTANGTESSILLINKYILSSILKSQVLSAINFNSLLHEEVNPNTSLLNGVSTISKGSPSGFCDISIFCSQKFFFLILFSHFQFL